MKNQQGFTLFGLIYAIIMLLGVGGWIANVYKLATVTQAVVEWGVMEIMRVVGIFIPPLGAVLGFL